MSIGSFNKLPMNFITAGEIGQVELYNIITEQSDEED